MKVEIYKKPGFWELYGIYCHNDEKFGDYDWHNGYFLKATALRVAKRLSKMTYEEYKKPTKPIRIFFKNGEQVL